MITIRPYEECDADSVGRLIAETYASFNLASLSPAQRDACLGPFRHAASPDPAHRQAIAAVLRSPMAYVAEHAGELVGVLRGRAERLASLFVRADHHRRGIGRMLVERFEQDSMAQGVTVIRLAATRYAVPFYLALGYKRSTGVRPCWSFEGLVQVQPMRKILRRG